MWWFLLAVGVAFWAFLAYTGLNGSEAKTAGERRAWNAAGLGALVAATIILIILS